MHELLLAHALSIGVEMRTGLNVIAFRQNEIVGKAGIILDNGERIEGDVVVCVGVGNFGREDISVRNRHTSCPLCSNTFPCTSESGRGKNGGKEVFLLGK